MQHHSDAPGDLIAEETIPHSSEQISESLPYTHLLSKYRYIDQFKHLIKNNLSFIAVLIILMVFYLWRISINGVSNAYYSGAVWAASKSWHAWFFGAIDVPGIITPDKPPMSTWWMGLWAHIFGYSYAKALIPQVILLVITMMFLFALVARWSNRNTALISVLIMGFTPISTMMYRHTNPEAMLTTLLTIAVYTSARAIEKGSYIWMSLIGLIFGFIFLTKDLEGLVLVPSIGIFLLIFSRTSLRKRIIGLMISSISLIVGSGWFALVIALVPVDKRPYIGGSNKNSLFDLAFGYNGIERLYNDHSSPTFNNPTFGGGESSPSFYRLLTNEFGLDIGWFLITAFIAIGYLLYITWKLPVHDPKKTLIWLLIAWFFPFYLVFSAMSGVIHPYYVVVLIPPIAAVVSIALWDSWQKRYQLPDAIIMALLILSTSVTSFSLMHRAPMWFPTLQYCILISGIIACIIIVTILVKPQLQSVTTTAILIITMVISLFTGIGSYSLSIINRPVLSGLPTASPVPVESVDPFIKYLDIVPTTSALALLKSTHTQWSAAVPGALFSAQWEVLSHTSIIGLGGFLGGDPAPIFTKFQQLVSEKKISYYISADLVLYLTNGAAESSNNPSVSELEQIDNWVKKNFPHQSIDGFVFYNLLHRSM